jgi:hypothetical protein
MAFIGGVAVALALTAVVAPPHPASAAEVASRRHAAAAGGASAAVLDVECWDCGGGTEIGCSETEHKDDIHVTGPGNMFSGQSHEGCTVSEDPDHLCGEHSWCNSFHEELYAQAKDLMKREKLRALGALVAANSFAFKVDADRQSLLILGCDGNERWSLAAPTKFLETLSVADATP